MTPADLEAGNLLPRPSTIVSSAAGVVYFLLFEKSIGPMPSDDDVIAWVEQGGKLSALPPVARNGDAVGICVKGKSGATVQNAFLPLDGAPAFAQADLTITFALQGSDPRKLPDYVAAAAQTTEIDDGIVAQGKRIVDNVVTAVEQNKDSIVHAAKTIAVVVLIAGALYLAIQIVSVVKAGKAAA